VYSGRRTCIVVSKAHHAGISSCPMIAMELQRMRGRTLAIMNRCSRASYRGSTVEMMVAMKPASSATGSA